MRRGAFEVTVQAFSRRAASLREGAFHPRRAVRAWVAHGLGDVLCCGAP